MTPAAVRRRQFARSRKRFGVEAVRAHQALGGADARRRGSVARGSASAGGLPKDLRPLAQSLRVAKAGVLSLAFVSTADYGLLPRLLREFGARSSRVRL